METRRRVLSDANGSPSARVMFIAEAPGRFGGDTTGIPLTNDASGRHFRLLLAESQVNIKHIFITNAVLCNPRDAQDRNRKPHRTELQNCSGWLRLQIAVIDPRVIVTLGVTALHALGSLEAHEYRLRTHCRRSLPWAGRTLIPLYHPSPLVRPWRSDAEQLQDFLWLGEYLRDSGLLGGDDLAHAPGR